MGDEISKPYLDLEKLNNNEFNKNYLVGNNGVILNKVAFASVKYVGSKAKMEINSVEEILCIRSIKDLENEVAEEVRKSNLTPNNINITFLNNNTNNISISNNNILACNNINNNSNSNTNTNNLNNNTNKTINKLNLDLIEEGENKNFLYSNPNSQSNSIKIPLLNLKNIKKEETNKSNKDNNNLTLNNNSDNSYINKKSSKNNINNNNYLLNNNSSLNNIEDIRISKVKEIVQQYKLEKDIHEVYLFGLFDGNNGDEVSFYLKEYFGYYILKSKCLNNNEYDKALLESIFAIDNSLITEEGLSKLHEITRLSNKYYENYDKIHKLNPSNSTDKLLNALNLNNSNLLEIENNIKNNLNEDNKDLDNCLELTNDDIEEIKIFKSILDPRCNASNSYNPIPMFVGSNLLTCLLVFNHNENKDKYIECYLATVGNSRALIKLKDLPIKQLTLDHIPSDLNEHSRILKADGEIVNGKVNNNLKSSRSIGNFEYKLNPYLPMDQNIVSCMPDIIKLDIKSDTSYLIFVNSGITELVSNEEIYSYIEDEMSEYDIVSNTEKENKNMEEKDDIEVVDDIDMNYDKLNIVNKKLKLNYNNNLNKNTKKLVSITEYAELLEKSITNMLNNIIIRLNNNPNIDPSNYGCIVIKFFS